MFSGIIEALGEVIGIEQQETNLVFTIKHPFKEDLYIDQSISHNGTCLTITSLEDDTYTVVAIKETLDVTNLIDIKVGDWINLERSITMETRMDGHMVQGHVDCIASVSDIKDENGSWVFSFNFPSDRRKLLIQKGSITINGISLTVAALHEDELSVAIIPYTYEHTNLKDLQRGSHVNIEFDMIGKYVANYMEALNS